MSGSVGENLRNCRLMGQAVESCMKEDISGRGVRWVIVFMVGSMDAAEGLQAGGLEVVKVERNHNVLNLSRTLFSVRRCLFVHARIYHIILRASSQAFRPSSSPSSTLTFLLASSLTDSLFRFSFFSPAPAGTFLALEAGPQLA